MYGYIFGTVFTVYDIYIYMDTLYDIDIDIYLVLYLLFIIHMDTAYDICMDMYLVLYLLYMICIYGYFI